MSEDILIIDDEADIRNLIQGILEDEGYTTFSCASSTDAYELLKTRTPSLIIQDIWLQGSPHDGLEILKTVKNSHPHIPFVMISGHGTIETAVSAIRDGAYDFIEKPFKADRLILMIQRALETAALKKENAVLKRQSVPTDTLVGTSPAIENLKQVIEKAAPTNSRVLLTGDPGTGKNVVARYIHQYSERADQPFLIVNCATLHPERLEAELFGVANSNNQQVGLLEQAHMGTLLLDEIGDMSLETQAKIVRVLQEQRFQKIGGSDFIDSDVRILATTNRDLKLAMEKSDFREDLYYRLNVVPLHIPPLSERAEDIVALAEHFLETLGIPLGVENKSFKDSALQVMKRYPWPGNVRQLRNVIEWVLIMHGHQVDKAFTAEHLPPEITGQGTPTQNDSETGDTPLLQDYYLELELREAREAFEREYLLSQMNRFDGNVSKTAQFVGMERSALHRKLKSLEASAEEKKQDANIHKLENAADTKDSSRKRA